MTRLQFAEGDRTVFDLLGGKGPTWPDDASPGPRSPATISTEACRYTSSTGVSRRSSSPVDAAVHHVEGRWGASSATSDPLLLSSAVRCPLLDAGNDGDSVELASA